jgi:hypothetical protein
MFDHLGVHLKYALHLLSSCRALGRRSLGSRVTRPLLTLRLPNVVVPKMGSFVGQ